jgi:hypothetical protein
MKGLLLSIFNTTRIGQQIFKILLTCCVLVDYYGHALWHTQVSFLAAFTFSPPGEAAHV